MNQGVQQKPVFHQAFFQTSWATTSSTAYDHPVAQHPTSSHLAVGSLLTMYLYKFLICDFEQGPVFQVIRDIP